MNIREKLRNVRVNKMRVLISFRGGRGRKRKVLIVRGENWRNGYAINSRGAEALYLETDDEIFPYVKIKRDGWPTLRIATSK